MEFDKAKAIIDEKRLTSILEQLSEPFPADEIYWKPQATNKEKTKAMAAAYADPRAYSDRLNNILGPDKWSEMYSVSTIPPSGDFKGKVLVIATLTIEGVGTHSGTGEAESTDDNAMTSAEAQAFKRAAVRFGLGRYLYDLPKNQWCDYDQKTRRITSPPTLPEWAIPKVHCDSCHNVIEPYQWGDTLLSPTDLINNSIRKYKQQLCANCQKIMAAMATKTAKV